MRKQWLRIVCLLLAAVLALSLAGCGKEEDDAAVNAAAKDYVFREAEVDLNDLPMSDVRYLCKVGERICLYGMNYGENGQEEYLVMMNPDGSDIQSVQLHFTNYGEGGGGIATPLPMPVVEVDESTQASEEGETTDETVDESIEETTDDGIADEPTTDEYPSASTSTFVNGMTSDGNQLYFLLVEAYNDYASGTYEETFYVVAADTQGNELWRQKLGANGSESMSYFYAGTIVGTQDGVLCSCSLDNVGSFILIDANGNKKDEIAPEGVESGSMFANHKGDIYIQYWTQVGEVYQQVIQKLDLAAKTVSDPLEIPGMSAYSLSICPYMFGGSYDIYLTDGMSVYGYNEGDADKTKLLNYIDSDIDNSWMNYTVILSDTQMLAVGMDYEANDYRGALLVSQLTKVDPADVVDKTVLKLACYGTMYSLRPGVVEFNKSNDKYRIQIEDYSTYMENGDWTSGITRLNNDIIAGNVPDILYLTADLPVTSYINQGLFVDLYPFIEKDPEMEREDFLTNILEAFSVDGELYQLVPSFSVRTVVGKSQHVGAEPGWTIDEMIAAVDAMPEGTAVYQEMVRTDFLNTILTMSGDQFVDWLNAECYFDTDEFVKLLEFCNRFPEEFDYSVYEDEDYWLTYESAYREDRVLLQNMFLNTYQQYQQMKYGTFGEDITMIGFPTTEGNGAIITYDASWAITAKSKHQEGAWEYVRQYLMPENQDDYGYGWPLRWDSLEALQKRAMEKPYYIDENGNKVEYDDTYWIGDKQITIPPLNQEEVDAVTEILTTVTEVAGYNTDLNTIIFEEAQAFFSGQKTAREVADIIQSRAWVYVSENQ